MRDGAQVDRTAGDVHQFPAAPHVASWARLSPKDHESDAHVHRGPITTQDFRLARRAAVESV